MRREVYDEVVRAVAVPVGASPHWRRLLERHGTDRLSREALASIAAQEAQSRVIKHNHLIKQRVHALAGRYLAGEDILVLSVEVDFPPCMLMRRILEHLVPGSKQLIGDVLKQPARVDALLALRHHTTHPDIALQRPPLEHMAQRLRTDVSRCVLCDVSYSPLCDLARQAAGQEFELLLADQLRGAGVTAFWTEAQLRAQGHFKTPDIALHVPVGVRVPARAPRLPPGSQDDGSTTPAPPEWRPITWMDSKATFGDDRIHGKQLQEQYLTYVNRYGPGLVIYWFGYIDDLDTHPDVLLMDHCPTADELLVLPQLPCPAVHAQTCAA